jgi:hypothetical protein
MRNGTSIDPDEMLRAEFVVEILRYVVGHPGAKDTSRGIEKWWLSPGTLKEGRRNVEERLDLLVSMGWLIGRSSPRAETIYSLNESRLPEIKLFLEKF